MRFKAILAEAARKRYPLSILLMVVGVLFVPFPFLIVRFGLELRGIWWDVFSIALGIVSGCVVIGLGSLVEDIHDIAMHTMGYDLELTEVPEEEPDDSEEISAQSAEPEAASEE